MSEKMAPDKGHGEVAYLRPNQDFHHNRPPAGPIDDYKIERIRVESFSGFSSPVDIRSLAAAGFYFTKSGDIVKCIFCGVEIGRWELGDDPMVEHKKWSRNCRFLNHMDVGNVPIDPANPPPLPPLDTSRAVDECGIYTLSFPNKEPVIPSLERLGIHKRYSPVHPSFATLESRIESFKSWPVGLKHRPEDLAPAGFFYTGFGDKTVCFQCGGGLKDWAHDDDPWREHAFYFSKCTFVLQTKGREYVNEVLGRTNPSPDPEDQPVAVPEYVNMVPNRLLPTTTESTQPSASVEERCSSSCSSSGVSSTCSQASASSQETTPEKSNIEKPSIDDARMCKICFQSELGVLFLPCGHLVSCVNCASSLTTCALCREPVTATVRAFLS